MKRKKSKNVQDITLEDNFKKCHKHFSNNCMARFRPMDSTRPFFCDPNLTPKTVKVLIIIFFFITVIINIQVKLD